MAKMACVFMLPIIGLLLLVASIEGGKKNMNFKVWYYVLNNGKKPRLHFLEIEAQDATHARLIARERLTKMYGQYNFLINGCSKNLEG